MLQKTPQPAMPVRDDTPAVMPQAEAQPDIAAVLKSGGSSRRWRRYLIVGAVAMLAGAGLWYWLAASTSSSAVTYTTAAVTRGDLTVTVTATGTVQPTNEVEVSSELSGTVSSVSVDFNDVVKKGQTLATLKTDKLDANVTQAQSAQTAREADVRQAEVTAGETARALDRAGRLLGTGVIAQEAYDTAKAAGDRASAALAVAKANLETAKANLSISQADRGKADILSPIDGVVLARNVEVGQTVAASLQAPVLFTLAEDLAKMQLEVNIDEADVGSIAEGDSAVFTVEAYRDRTFPAKIAQIRYSPATVEGVVAYKAILTVDNSELLLRPGMTATADITVEELKDTLMVPNAALRYSPPAAQTSRGGGAGLLGLLMPRPPSAPQQIQTTDGRSTVWVLRDNAPVAVSVKTGLSDGSHTAIADGDLTADDKVIVGAKSAS